MNDSSHGFSLIEVLVAAFVLSVALTASAVLFSNAVVTNAGNRYRTVATTLLQDKMEELRHRRSFDSGSYTELLAVPVTGRSHAFLRSWNVHPGPPHRLTVAIYRRRYGTHGPYDELARAATLVSEGF